ncbi:MAG: hypothetical protein WCS37_22705, partial [Chloroflexota bacterium]
MVTSAKKGKGVKSSPVVNAASLEDFEFDLTGLGNEGFGGVGVDLTQLPILTVKQVPLVTMESTTIEVERVTKMDNGNRNSEVESKIATIPVVIQPGMGRVVRIEVEWLVANPYQYRREITPESVADLVADFTRRGLSKALQSLPKVKHWRKRSPDPLT